MKLTKKSETGTKITFAYDKPPGPVEGYLYYAGGVRVSRTMNPNDLEVTFGTVPSGEYAVEAVGYSTIARADWPDTPPPTGTLRWKPPGYPNYTGYTTIPITQPGQNLSLDNAKDYVLDMSTLAWSSAASGRSVGLNITGGRNVVVIGGKFSFNRTNNQDDSTAVLVSDGADGGTVHLEGLDIDCANGITVRTHRIVQIENCRLKVWTYQDDTNGGAGIHPDVVQVWGTDQNNTPCAAIRMHKVTGYTRFTGLVSLVERTPGGQCDPTVWERYETDLHPDRNLNGTMDASNYAYMSSGPTGAANGPYTTFKGDVYAELPTGGNGAYVRKIDDIVILKTLSGGPKYFPYEIKAPDGTVLYTSPAAPTGGLSPMGIGAGAGNYLTFDRVPQFTGHKWFVGKPPGGDFCPAGVAGATYVSPGYV